MQARIDLPVAGMLCQPSLFVYILRRPRLAVCYPVGVSEHDLSPWYLPGFLDGFEIVLLNLLIAILTA